MRIFTKLEPFDPSARCPKCQYDAVKTKHEMDVWPPWSMRCATPLLEQTPVEDLPMYDRLVEAGWTRRDDRTMQREYLKRTCCRCEYEWAEACGANR